MKVVIQRVKRASVTGIFHTQLMHLMHLMQLVQFIIIYFIHFLVSEELVGSIQAGLCLLVGIFKDDTEKDLQDL